MGQTPKIPADKPKAPADKPKAPADKTARAGPAAREHGRQSVGKSAGKSAGKSVGKSAAPEFQSILQTPEAAENWRANDRPPDYFQDLNLDQIVAALTAGRTAYDLAPFFHTPLTSVAAIRYRQQVFGDLENDAVLAAVNAFAETMRTQRHTLAQADELYDRTQKELWFLNAVEIYTDAVAAFGAALAPLTLKSRGFQGLRRALGATVAGAEFGALVAEIAALKAALSEVRYTMQIGAGKVTVRKPAGEADYGAEIENTFARFKRHAANNYLASFPEDARMSTLEESVLGLVVRLYPETFARLDAFRRRHDDFVVPFIARYDREVQVYLATIEQTARLRRAGLKFCHPRVSARDKGVFCRDGFDLALALKLAADGKSVVCNDFALSGAERIIVVSGPNQGGKTTFARSFGQLCYLAALGLPIPGSAAHIFIFDQMFTQFERAEDVVNLRSKLEDDLRRIHAILARATPQSVIILNEIFSSTTLQDQQFLSRKVFERIIALDALCLSVTFLDELSRLDEKTVSMVSTVQPDTPSQRTFRIERRVADGLAYARAVAEKYRLTYGQLSERLSK